MNRAKAEEVTAKFRDRLSARYKSTITEWQLESQKGPAVPDPFISVSHVTFAKPPKDGILQALLQSIERLGDGTETFAIPELQPVEAEWLSCRDSAESEASPTLSNTPIIFFVHGGAFYRGSPASSRPTISRLVKSSPGSRAISIRYRLAPQYPFPASLLDIIVAYLSLLHTSTPPVPATRIVLAGESSGANLCLALLQFLLDLRRQHPNPTIGFHGKEVSVPLPAGVATACGYFDVTRALPSWTTSREYDILEPGPNSYLLPDGPTCAAWPVTPPRGEIYCDVGALAHPLVSPCAAEDWTGSPPMWLGYGEERLGDCNAVLAARARRCGVAVREEVFEGMPHLFFQFLGKFPAVRVCYEDWERFCGGVVNSDVEGGNTVFEIETGQERKINPDERRVVGYEEAVKLMRAKRDAGGITGVKAKF